MNPKLRIPPRLESWSKRWPRIARLMNSEYGEAALQAYESLAVDMLYMSITHGLGHIERAILFGALIAQDNELDSAWTRRVLLCCSYHDVGRHDDKYDLDHGRLSAEKIASTQLAGLFDNLPLARAAIHAHAIPDEDMDGVMQLYGITDVESFHLLTFCLKDADNLDRVRIYDLDTRFLRFPGTKAMKDMAYEILEEYNRIPTLLCYGDSNTFGYNPVNGGRYPRYLRLGWALQEVLGEDWNVVEDGVNGRTTAYPRWGSEWLSGLYGIKTAVASNLPVDVLVLFLGSNDCSSDMNLTAEESARGLERLVLKAASMLKKLQGYKPRIIILAPPAIEETVLTGPFASSFTPASLEMSRELPEKYRAVAEKHSCDFIDLNGVFSYWDLDSLHLKPFDSYRIARAIKSII